MFEMDDYAAAPNQVATSLAGTAAPARMVAVA